MSIQLNLPLLRRTFWRLLSAGHVDIRRLASQEWTLCAEETATAPPAIYLEGEIDRIQGLSPWRSRDTELALIRGGPGTHGAATAHILRDIDLVDGWLFKKAAADQPGYGSRSWLLRGRQVLESIEEAHLITSNAGSHFFGNLMLDDYPRALLPPDGSITIRMPTLPYRHDSEYRQLLGLPAPAPTVRARVRRLFIYTDFAQNSHKLSRYRRLRETLRGRLRAHNDTCMAHPPAGVFIRRGRDGEPRALANEAELEVQLNAAGFDILDPGTLSAGEIAMRTLDTPVVVAVEGSHLSHAIYSAADDATFVVLQPPDRFAMAYKEYTDRVGMRFAFVVGESCAGGFRVAPERLQRLLELVARIRNFAA